MSRNALIRELGRRGFEARPAFCVGQQYAAVSQWHASKISGCGANRQIRVESAIFSFCEIG
jgi:hypothetical protein